MRDDNDDDYDCDDDATHLQEVISHYFMKITVSQGTNIAGGFPDSIVDTRILTKHIVLA